MTSPSPSSPPNQFLQHNTASPLPVPLFFLSRVPELSFGLGLGSSLLSGTSCLFVSHHVSPSAHSSQPQRLACKTPHFSDCCHKSANRPLRRILGDHTPPLTPARERQAAWAWIKHGGHGGFGVLFLFFSPAFYLTKQNLPWGQRGPKCHPGRAPPQPECSLCCGSHWHRYARRPRLPIVRAPLALGGDTAVPPCSSEPPADARSPQSRCAPLYGRHWG